MKKILLTFFSIFLLALIYHHLNRPILVTTEEVVAADEDEQIAESVQHFINIVDNNQTDFVARGAHAKGHACVKAYFRVREDIAPEFRHGVFQTPGREFKTWIRFSNGASNVAKSHDANKDARGMAIKIYEPFVDQTKQETEQPPHQDFLMHDSPVFFTASMNDYNRFTVSKNKILYFVSDWNPFNWKLRELKHGLATLKPPPENPLQHQYFSNTAYKLGPHNIKFSARACDVNAATANPDTLEENYLRKVMQQHLQQTDACFHFQVQQQKPEYNMPIEDPSVLWQESNSPFITVADIHIPKQVFDRSEQNQFCENLSFSPWHALPAHRPIGALNRIRKEVYKASSDYRHKANQTTVPTNLAW